MFKLCFYVPESHLEVVKQALFAAGAGRVGDYEHCCWQVLGTGQFRPLASANPFIGKSGDLETLAEWRVELVLEEALAKPVIAALKAAHPYEEVAFDLVQVLDPALL